MAKEELDTELDDAVEIDVEESQDTDEAQVSEAAGGEDELESYSKNVKTRINKLTEKYRKEERDRQEAQRFAQQAYEENKKLKERLKLLDRGYVTEYGNRLQVELNTAKQKYRDAYDRGDTDEVMNAQEALTRINSEMERHRLAKARIEREEKEPVQTQQAQPQQAQPQQPRPDPRAQKWAERNEWFGKDRILTSAAFAIDATLTQDEGFDAGSDEYYTELDKRIRDEFPHKFPSSKKSGNGAQVASAVSSASRSPAKQGRRSVKLTASQVAMAKRLNVPLEEYAKYVKE
jgi:chromosome segregation ATPase